MKKKITLILLFTLALLLAFNARWVGYVLHLARHQMAVVFGKKEITGLLAKGNLTHEQRTQLQMVEKIRQFTEERYAMQKSRSYETYFDLGRKELGFNITVAPEFGLKPVSFDFFPIGSFDYLGFFSQDLAEKWAAEYRARGYDVHLAEIGGYSTLGWFDDPLYSSQLAWGEYSLARLLGHEIAHEKLYFKADTTFSELMASFIERRLAADFMRAHAGHGRPGSALDRRSILAPTGGLMPTEAAIAARRLRSDKFSAMIETTKTQLEQLYGSSLSNTDKKAKKAVLLRQLRDDLENKKMYFADIPAAVELARLPEINNATLIQFHRYSPAGQAFTNVFKSCQKHPNQYVCWFEKIAQLKPCSVEQRKHWVLGAGEISAATCAR